MNKAEQALTAKDVVASRSICHGLGLASRRDHPLCRGSSALNSRQTQTRRREQAQSARPASRHPPYYSRHSRLHLGLFSRLSRACPKPFSLSGLTPTGSSRQRKCPTRYPTTYRAHPAAPLSGCTSVITHNRNRHFAEAMRSPWVPMTHHNIGHHSMSSLTTGTQMSSVSLQAMVPISMLLREISATASTRQRFSPSVSHPTGISISRHTQRRPLPCTSPYVRTEKKQHRYW